MKNLFAPFLEKILMVAVGISLGWIFFGQQNTTEFPSNVDYESSASHASTTRGDDEAEYLVISKDGTAMFHTEEERDRYVFASGYLAEHSTNLSLDIENQITTNGKVDPKKLSEFLASHSK